MTRPGSLLTNVFMTAQLPVMYVLAPSPGLFHGYYLTLACLEKLHPGQSIRTEALEWLIYTKYCAVERQLGVVLLASSGTQLTGRILWARSSTSSCFVDCIPVNTTVWKVCDRCFLRADRPLSWGEQYITWVTQRTGLLSPMICRV